MSESAQYAARRAVQQRLAGAGAWGTRVRQDRGLSSWEFPYVVHVFSGGGERNRMLAHSDPELVLLVKAVSDIAAEASAAAAAIAALLDDSGLQDDADDYLYGGSQWHILSITQEDYITYSEYVSETRTLFHEGARYRFVMEAI